PAAIRQPGLHEPPAGPFNGLVAAVRAAGEQSCDAKERSIGVVNTPEARPASVGPLFLPQPCDPPAHGCANLGLLFERKDLLKTLKRTAQPVQTTAGAFDVAVFDHAVGEHFEWIQPLQGQRPAPALE